MRKLTVSALLLSCALVLGLAERAIPLDVAVPGVRLGLPNAVVLLTLYLFPFGQAFVLGLLKCVLTALLFGTFTSFLYSVSGFLLSVFVMLVLIRLAGTRLSPVGVSVAGAVFHNLGQLLAAAMVMGSLWVFGYLPVLLVSGAVTGTLVGVAVKYTLPYMKEILRQNAPYTDSK